MKWNPDQRGAGREPGRGRGPAVSLGATYGPARTEFCVFAPTARRVWVVLASEASGPAGRREEACEAIGGGLHRAVVVGNLEGVFYSYRLEGPGCDPRREIVDPYATCAQNRAARSLIVDPARTDPPGFRAHAFAWRGRPTDAVVYEVHVRDLTISPSSGVGACGRYAGLTERGTHVPGRPEVATGLSHLVELGVTHVQLMPVQDFDNEETGDSYDWGYMPVCPNSPEGWYASEASGPSRIVELKRAIQALHEAGVGVVLDVVYNHLAPRSSFERLAPGYYFRRDGRGRLSNGSGCGNELASERPLARRFILDSVTYWVREYRVDGFRFDGMALIDGGTMARVKAALRRLNPRVLLYGEPWAAGPTPLKTPCDKHWLPGRGIGAFNDVFRDALKGGRSGRSRGFIQSGERVGGIRAGLSGVGGSRGVWPRRPAETVNYFECHDDLTAWDKLRASVPRASEEVRERMSRLGALILLTSQGMVFLHAGQEFGRSKGGCANSYDQPDRVNAIDWELKVRRGVLCAYTRGLIALRRSHAALRLVERRQVASRVSFEAGRTARCLVYRIDGRGLRGESARRVLVLLNGEACGVEFALPRGRWRIYADAERAGAAPLGSAEEQVRLPGHSGMVLMR